LKYWRGYITAAVLGAITWVVMAFGQRFTVLVDMVYPYVVRTLQTILAEWSSKVDFNLWQMGAIALAVVGLATVVLMIELKWNPIQWFGWVLAAASGLYLCHMLVFGLNYYAGPLAEDIRLEVVEYNVEELTEAAIYYRDKANDLANQVKRDGSGNPQFPEFEVLAEQAADGFHSLTYESSLPVFAGSTLPVKKLAWADLYTSMSVTGITMGLTGEASVNPQTPPIALPFTMCHEMAHRMCIASERDANFAAFLACQANESVEFQYSAYFMAYRYCYNALAKDSSQEASAAAARVSNGVNDNLYQDMVNYTQFYSGNQNATAASAAATANDTYLKASGETEGIKSYGQVCDLLVSWHIQEVVLPSITVVEKPFDPFDESQVDLTGIVNAKTEEPTEETEPNE
jgi:hypothetical protein